MLAWFIPWYIIHIYRYDRFEAFRIKRFLRLELRSLMTLQLFLALLFLFIYDVGTARIKYWEGFWLNPKTQEIVSKPAPFWSKSNQEHVQPIYYILSLALAFQNCAIFLLQSWWHYITSPKNTFKSSFEFRLHTVASVLALITYPLLQHFLRDDVHLREAIPQLVFSSMLLFLAILGVRTYFRLKRFMKTVIPDMNEHNFVLINKLDYFADVNKVLMFTFAVAGITLGILSVDGLSDGRVIANNKFASDFLACNLNFVQPIMWTAVTLLLYPRKSFTHGYRPAGAKGEPTRMVSDPTQGLSFPRKSEQTGGRNSRGSLQANGTHIPMDSQRYSRDEPADIASFIAYVPPSNPAPAVTAPTRPSRPRVETSTLYYHEGLIRQAQEQLLVPPLPRSSEYLLKDVESLRHADSNETDARVRPLSPTTPTPATMNNTKAPWMPENVELSVLNGHEQDNGLLVDERKATESDDSATTDGSERPASRTRAKPNTQTLALHYGPLYHQQYQTTALQSPSSSSTTMVSSTTTGACGANGASGQTCPKGHGRSSSQQSSRSTATTMTHHRQPSADAAARPETPVSVAHLAKAHQPVVYLSSPLQYLQPYVAACDNQPDHSASATVTSAPAPPPAVATAMPSSNQRKRASPPVPPREKRASDGADGNNPYSLKIVSQQHSFGQGPLQQYQYTHHPHRPMSPMGWDDSATPSNERYGRVRESSMGDITIQLQ
ncbi:hypothetical protein BGZ73_007519 [Actinomortierella ambigua]|nr:hypothetical protein BGZ73_007519 [Actinomortierella ambigua]